MIADYFDAEKTGGSKTSLEITVDIKADKVMDFAHEIRDAVIEEVLEIIDATAAELEMWESDVRVLKERIQDLSEVESNGETDEG